MENPIKMDDLGVPLFLETPIYLKVILKHDYCLLCWAYFDPTLDVIFLWQLHHPG